MDNQHRKIRGYRELTQAEIDLMNRIKRKEAELLALVGEVQQHLAWQEQMGADEQARQREAMAHRWAQIGKTDIETGVMALVRAVAQPQPTPTEDHNHG